MTIRHRRARGATVADIALQMGITQHAVRDVLSKASRKLVQLRYWGNQYTAAEDVFYSEQGQRLDALARDLERRAAFVEERWNAPLREHEKSRRSQVITPAAPLEQSLEQEGTGR